MAIFITNQQAQALGLNGSPIMYNLVTMLKLDSSSVWLSPNNRDWAYISIIEEKFISAMIDSGDFPDSFIEKLMEEIGSKFCYCAGGNKDEIVPFVRAYHLG